MSTKPSISILLEDIDPDNVRSTFNSNIVGMIVLTKFALAHMKRGSTIVNSTSVTAYKGSAGMLDCMSFQVYSGRF